MISSIVNKDTEYISYIRNHCKKVKESFDKYGKSLCEAIEADYIQTSRNISVHDSSKYSEEEFIPYRNKFYPDIPVESQSEEMKTKIEKAFEKAWEHHYFVNPHHPEHWIDNKSNTQICNDMPPEYIVEMICDWESFRKDDGSGGAYKYYYYKDKKENLLSDTTRQLLEKALEVVK